MDPREFRETVESDRSAELARIEEGPLVRAMAGGDPEPRPVLAAAARAEFAAHTTFGAWAGTESHEGARVAFAATAEQERDHYERVLGRLPDADALEPVDGGPIHSYLRAREGTAPRVAAGMVGRSLVSVRGHDHLVEFFARRADPARTELFRDLRVETRDTLAWGLSLLRDVCSGPEDWRTARSVAGYVVDLAHDDYADALAGWDADRPSE